VLHRIDGKRFRFLELRFESGREIACAVFEKHDETEGKEDEQSDPEQSTNQGHGDEVTLRDTIGQRSGSHASLRLKRLLASCADARAVAGS
jgi:hypothetical protein